MANGKGTISCWYCRHYVGRPVGRCCLYSTDLPVWEIGTDNPVCLDFAESRESSPEFAMPGQLAELAPGMKRGYLYAFPYPSHDRLADLREVAKLSS